MNIYIACRDAMMTEYNLDEAKIRELKKDWSNFFKYLCQDDSIPANEMSSLSATELAEKKKQLMTGEEHCANFERHIYYKIGKIIWHDHGSVYEEQLKYLQNDICKPYKYSMIQYTERVRDLFEILK